MQAQHPCCRVRDDGHELTAFVCDNGTAIRKIMLMRTTHTNEPARRATLLPALARLPQPVARLEVGASAGPCLLPGHHGYDYGQRPGRRRTANRSIGSDNAARYAFTGQDHCISSVQLTHQLGQLEPFSDLLRQTNTQGAATGPCAKELKIKSGQRMCYDD